MAKGSLFHWGPLTALSIIMTLFIGSIYSSLLWWPPDDISGVLNIALLLVFLLCILYNFVKAAWVGPGYVLHQWKPVNDEDKKLVQFCQVCDVHKAPRSHHCRQCNRCVLKMDHHCPWINNCVGHKNHKRFTLFLFFVVIGCSYSAYSLIGCIYSIIYAKINIFKESFKKTYAQHMGELLRNLIQVDPYVYRRIMEEHFVSFGFYHLFGIIFCVGLDLGVIIAVGILLYYQARDIIRNESSIEAWIVEKSSYRSSRDDKFIYPYNLGRWENIKQVIHFSGDFIGDGITWPVVEGCNQYTLTVEQLRQKQMKKHCALFMSAFVGIKAANKLNNPPYIHGCLLQKVEYSGVEDFNGSFCGLRQGCLVCICLPWSLERRLKFKKGDHILVTRWRKHWLYGAKMPESDNGVKDPEKGWFPRICAVRDDENDNMESNKKEGEKKTKHE